MAEVDDIILSMKDSLPQFKKREQDLEYCLIKFVMAASLSNQRNGPRDNLKSESNLDLTNAVKTVMNEVIQIPYYYKLEKSTKEIYEVIFVVIEILNF